MVATGTTYYFDQVEVRAAQRQILVGGQSAPLRPRAFDLLLALIERRERTVSKQELLETVWPGTYVEEHNLAVQIGNLRKLFGPTAIATIPGRGYRFTAPLLHGPDARSEARSDARPAATPAAWPPAAAPLIGREEDLARLNEQLQAHRLVTVVGAGGIGKTCLAQRITEQRRALHAHGVGWVELGALTDGAQITGAIARTLGLDLGRAATPALALAEAMRPLKLLLALDNVEHLAADVAGVVDALMQAAKGVQVLVTSQVPLGHEAELVVRLEPLQLPPEEATAAEAAQYGAVALFVARAQAADRRFALDDDNVAAVVEICRRLDGIALALELAAARVPLLGVKGLAHALHDRLRVLSSKRRDALLRHQTLQATLDWSHHLLPDPERVLLRRLSVFAGSFSLELALQVMHDPGTPTPHGEWLDALAHLIDRSMVLAEASDPPRCRLLESTRAYALERLAEAGEHHAWHARHAHALCRHLGRIFEERMAAFDPALRLLEREVDNARQAFNWARQHDAPTAVALAHPLAMAMGERASSFSQNLWSATEPLLQESMDAKVRADWALGASLWNHTDTHYRAHWARTAVELSRQIGDKNRLMFALMAMVKSRPGTFDEEQRQAFEELRQLNTPERPAGLQMRALLMEGNILSMSGEAAQAQEKFRQALQLSAQACDSLTAYGVLLSAIDAELKAGSIDEAVQHSIDLVQRLRATRSIRFLTVALFNLCLGQLLQGSVAQARATAREAWPLACTFQLQVHLCDHLALLAALEGRAEVAMQLAGCADARHAQLALEREANEKRVAEQALALARAGLDDQEAQRLYARGAELVDAEIEALLWDAR